MAALNYADAQAEMTDIRTPDQDALQAPYRFYASTGLPHCVERYLDALRAADGDVDAAHRADPGALTNLTLYGARYGWNVRRAQEYYTNH